MNSEKKSSRYVKKGPKPYQIWVNNHKDEILNIESKKRTDYVHEHLNNDLNLKMSKYEIYQLLYRNKLIDRKHKNIHSDDNNDIHSNDHSNDNNDINNENYTGLISNINIPETVSGILSQLTDLRKSNIDPEIINNTIEHYLSIMNKINENINELINFKNELNSII